jgi:hypothetical protein
VTRTSPACPRNSDMGPRARRCYAYQNEPEDCNDSSRIYSNLCTPPARFSAMLWPIAQPALALLTGPDLHRVKRCAGYPWLFLDRSKNASRTAIPSVTATPPRPGRRQHADANPHRPTTGPCSPGTATHPSRQRRPSRSTASAGTQQPHPWGTHYHDPYKSGRDVENHAQTMHRESTYMPGENGKMRG